MEPWTVLLDVDGTLVDTNYLHTLAWWRTFRDAGAWAPMNAIHRLIGMGGDNLVTELLGERDDVDELSDSRAEHYRPLMDEAVPFPGASELIRQLHRQGMKVVLATSSPEHEVDHMVGLLDVDGMLDAITNADDVSHSKPDPEIFRQAMERVGADPKRTIAVGDSVWDIQAATAAGVPCIALESGGYSTAELNEAGAAAVVRGIADVGAVLAEMTDVVVAG